MKHVYLQVGAWVVRHYQDMARRIGIPKTIERMRKQGMPIEVCLPILNVGPAEVHQQPEPHRSWLSRFFNRPKGTP